MTKDQARALALRLSTELAASIGDGYFVVERCHPGQTPVFWVTDNPEAADNPDLDLDPSEATYASPVESRSKPGCFIVEQNNTDGGGFVYTDPDGDVCFETSF